MLRFQKGQTPSDVSSFVEDLGFLTKEFVIGKPATDVFLMLEEGHPITEIELRNTEEEWEPLIAAVQSGGSEEFRDRVVKLGMDRRSLSGLTTAS